MYFLIIYVFTVDMTVISLYNQKQEIARKELRVMAMTLKAARVNKGLTQREAAELLGVSKDTLWNYENSKTYPDVPVIKKIEEVYDIGYNDIVFLPKNNG